MQKPLPAAQTDGVSPPAWRTAVEAALIALASGLLRDQPDVLRDSLGDDGTRGAVDRQPVPTWNAVTLPIDHSREVIRAALRRAAGDAP